MRGGTSKKALCGIAVSAFFCDWDVRLNIVMTDDGVDRKNVRFYVVNLGATLDGYSTFYGSGGTSHVYSPLPTQRDLQLGQSKVFPSKIEGRFCPELRRRRRPYGNRRTSLPFVWLVMETAVGKGNRWQRRAGNDESLNEHGERSVPFFLWFGVSRDIPSECQRVRPRAKKREMTETWCLTCLQVWMCARCRCWPRWPREGAVLLSGLEWPC